MDAIVSGLVSAAHVRRGAGRFSERGAVSVELVLVVPAVLLVVGLFVFGFRLWSARSATLSAAEAAARAATLAGSSSAGQAIAQETAAQDLALLGVHCSPAQVATDAAGLSRPAGTRASVRVTVTCRVPMRDLLLPGAPGAATVTRSASEVVDTFSERRP